MILPHVMETAAGAKRGSSRKLHARLAQILLGALLVGCATTKGRKEAFHWRFELGREDVYLLDEEPDPDPHPLDKDASGVDVESVELSVNGIVLRAGDLRMFDLETRQPIDISDFSLAHYRVRIGLETLAEHLRVGSNEVRVTARDNAGGEIERENGKNVLHFDLTQEALDEMKRFRGYYCGDGK